MTSAKSIRIGVVAGAAVVVGGLLLVSGTVSAGVLLLIGLFAFCPLMMLGMHGVGHQNGDAPQATQLKDQETPVPTRPHVH